MVRDANLSLLADITDRVGIGGGVPVGNENTDNILVEVVVGKDHAAVSAAASVGAVDVALEKVVTGGAEGRLDIVVILRHDVVDLAEVGTIV